MEETNPTFEYDILYPTTERGSLLLEAHDVSPESSDFSTRGDLDYGITQQADQQTIDQAFEDVMNEIEMHAHLPHTGSSCMESQYEHQQCSSERQSELQPVSMQDNPNLVDKDTCTKSGGVFSPPKVPPARSSQITVSPYHCPRCDTKMASRRAIKQHFSRCIMKHGNPDALKWDDHASLQPLRQGEIKDKARRDNCRDSLKACSGIEIPSRLRPGRDIVKFVSSAKVSSVGQANHLCAICGGGPFSTVCHVKSHFIVCVGKHGNPTAASWYDRLDPKRIKKYLPKRPDATANTAPTM